MLLKNIEKGIKENEQFEKYINIIKDTSTTIKDDLQSIEYLLENHTIEQVTSFMPRFISLL